MTVIVNAQKEALLRSLASKLRVELWPEHAAAVLDGALEKIVNGGWRAGKSTIATLDLLCDVVIAVMLGKRENFWLVGPDYPQTKQEFSYLRDWCEELGLIVGAVAEPQDGSRHFMVTGGSEVTTKSASNMKSLGSVPVKTILVCEAGQLEEDARYWLQGRVSETGGRIIYSGTLEDENGNHPRFAWYTDASQRWEQERTRLYSAYGIPSWANRAIYGDCRYLNKGVVCPVPCGQEGEHGEAHGGEMHPQIQRFKQDLRDATGADFTFEVRYAGKASGILNQIYDVVETALERIVVELPEKMRDPHYRWAVKGGGMDFGTVHPSDICWGAVEYETHPRGHLWVLANEMDYSGNVDWIWGRQKALQRLEGVTVWGNDPMVKYAPTYLNSEPMSGSMFSREARVGLCRGLVIAGRVSFVKDGPGIATFDSKGRLTGGLVHNITHVRRKKTPSGELTYDRTDDDPTAAWEDMCAALFGKPLLNLPRALPRGKRQSGGERKEYSRV